MSGPGVITCHVCGTQNEASRTYCRKCAAELRPPAKPLPPAPAIVPPSLDDGGSRTPLIAAGVVIAILAIALVVGLLVLRSGGPAATVAPTAAPTATPTLAPTLAPTVAPTQGPTAAPTATPQPVPTIVSFVGPTTVDCSDPSTVSTIRLGWQLANATGADLAIDGPGLYDSYPGLSTEVDVPFTCGDAQHTYRLTTTGGLGPPMTQELVVRPG